MTLLNRTEGWTILIAFSLSMFTLAWLKTRGTRTADGFLVADRRVSVAAGAFSVAVAWIWAPAIFICSMQSYTKGLPGIFWFTAPNIVCFFVFAPIGVRLRRLMPEGYTLPEFVARRFPGARRTHYAFLCVFFGYQLGAVVINCLAGGALLHALSGIDTRVAVVALSLTAVSYSLLSGLRASIFTDIIQMLMVLVVAFTLVPWAVVAAGGWSVVVSGLGGRGGEHASLFDPWVAYTMGIPMTLGLVAGPIGDQMFFQRAMAVPARNIARIFVYGGLLFGVVPVVLSLLGFLGASPSLQGALTVSDPQMVGPVVVAHFLPRAALVAFCLLAFAGLCSTLDSSFCAQSSLGAIDVYRRYVRPEASDAELLRASRRIMAMVYLAGTGIALLQPKLLWVFLAYGALASAGMFPTILSLYWSRLPSTGAFWAVTLSLALGTPLSIYANVTESPHLIVVAAAASVVVGLVVCLAAGLTYRGPRYQFEQLAEEA